MHQLPLKPGERRERTTQGLSQRHWAGELSTAVAVEPALPRVSVPNVPSYLKETYTWAYLSQRGLDIFDRPIVVSAILWGNYHRLKQVAIDELVPGQKVLQVACVYGSFSADLAQYLGPDGKLEVIDVAPVQVTNCQRKLRDFPNARVRLADAADPGDAFHDAICCFFLLHEVPEDYKRRVVNALLKRVAPGGKVVFVDYHRPHWAHPLKGLMSLVFDTLEPFAKGLWHHAVSDYADDAISFAWTKQTYFGGLYQKTVARRLK